MRSCAATFNFHFAGELHDFTCRNKEKLQVRFAEVTPCLLQFVIIERLVSRLRLRLCRPSEVVRLSGAPIVEKAVATSERPSAVDVEESLVLWHPSHVVAIWAASASEVMLQGLVALSLILLVAADAVGGR